MEVEDLRDTEKDKLVEQMVEECIVKFSNSNDSTQIIRPSSKTRPLSKPYLAYKSVRSTYTFLEIFVPPVMK